MIENWHIKIIDKGYTLLRDVFIWRNLSNGKVELLNGDIIESNDGNVCISKPTLQLTPEQLQSFADALNEIGFNPKQGFMEGKLEATEKHLEDMRKLLKLKRE
ncbi:MAG: hypothetical protein AABY22_17495 [Nanoarchaeota archaeon]